MDEAQSDRSAQRRLILNPVSGGADHADRGRRLAAIHQFPMVETKRWGHAAELDTEAATDGIDQLRVCGGDQRRAERLSTADPFKSSLSRFDTVQ
jgi:hypothetical protein